MLIRCPYCGPRDLAEFTVLGEAVARPAVAGDPGAAVLTAAFAEAVYVRDNPAGPHRESWYHGPCRSWLSIERDTRDHRILAVALAGRPA